MSFKMALMGHFTPDLRKGGEVGIAAVPFEVPPLLAALPEDAQLSLPEAFTATSAIRHVCLIKLTMFAVSFVVILRNQGFPKYCFQANRQDPEC